MSLGYAEKLSYRNDVGDVGMSEVFDPPHVLEQKIAELAAIIKESKHLVAFTGAGISTSCGIPDFRGPKGVWTLRREGKEVPEASVLFHRAIPSMTHMALVELEKAGILKFVISQNVDCLHLRSGIPREKLAELHGNSFKEICPSCGLEYLRDFEIESIGMKSTSRNCSDVECGARLRDTIIDWENELPASEMKPAKKHCRKADVILCLGTSLQIAPACNLPIKALNRGGNMVIVNLQETPHDAKASLVIHGLVDKVIAGVMQYINLRIPPYVRVDLFQISLTHCSKPLSTEKKYVKWALRVESVHGPKALLPFVVSVEVSFPGRPNLKPAVLHKQPFRLKSLTIKFRTLASKKNVPGQIRGTSISSLRLARTHGLVQVRPKVMANLFPEVELTVIEVTSNDTPPVPKPTPLTLNFGDGCGCQSASIEFPVDLQAEADNISHNKKSVIENLIRSQRCGQISIIERKNLVSPKQEITVFAVVTNVIQYGSLPANSSYTLSKNGKLVRRQNDDVRCSGVSLKKKKCY